MTRSGSSPSCSYAKNVPVRPRPGLHLVDAEQRTDLARDLAPPRATNSVLERHHAALAEDRLDDDRRELAAGRDRAPRATRRRSAARTRRRGRAARSPPTSPAGPSTESAPSVRPWKPPSSATIRARPVALRATLSAASFASAPELQKNACAPPPGARRGARRGGASAPSSRGSTRARAGRAARARRRSRPDAGGRAPTTAIPPPKSRYARPSSSQTRQPSPRTIVTSARA